MTREEIQNQALKSLKNHNYNGVVVLSTGSGKSKCAIDAIKEGKFEHILITSPRTNLKENWKKELEKWGICKSEGYGADETEYDIQCGPRINIEIVNIQTAYKYSLEQIESFSLIIYDEIHTCGEEYFNLIRNAKQMHVPVIGLTGTPNKSNEFKKDILYKELPIIYEYLDSAKDGIVNKTNYYKFEYELNDDYKVLTGTKDKKWLVGEKTQYEYLEKQYALAKNLMFQQGADNYFTQSLIWMKSGDAYQKEAGRKFFYAVKNRKDFLWNLASSVHIALKIKNKILGTEAVFLGDKIGNEILNFMSKYGVEEVLFGSYNLKKENITAATTNKVLLFSELTQQAEKLSPYSIHSKTGETAKKTLEQNSLILDKFNKGEIRELSSCLSLTLGLNMNNVNWAIFESFSGSDTNAKQRGGRLQRLESNQFANAVVIVPKNTQSGSWFDSAFSHIENIKVITNLNEIII